MFRNHYLININYPVSDNLLACLLTSILKYELTILMMCVHEKTRQEVIQLKSPILLKLGTNVGFGE